MYGCGLCTSVSLVTWCDKRFRSIDFLTKPLAHVCSEFNGGFLQGNI